MENLTDQAKKYVNGLSVDYGDLNHQAEAQLAAAWIDGYRAWSSEKEMIAFRSVDSENDIWCEHCFLFDTEEEVREFFRPDNPQLLSVFNDTDDPDGAKGILDFEIYDGNPANLLNGVKFYTEYAGTVRIVRMSGGYYWKGKKSKP